MEWSVSEGRLPWVEPGKVLNLDSELIKQMVPGTLDRATINEQLAALKKAIFERAGGGGPIHHLGYEKGEAKRRYPEFRV